MSIEGKKKRPWLALIFCSRTEEKECLACAVQTTVLLSKLPDIARIRWQQRVISLRLSIALARLASIKQTLASHI